MRNPILLCCCWLLCLSPFTQAAQTSAEDWFEIEVLLFKRNQPENLDEQWPQQGERRLEGARRPLIEPFARATRVSSVIDGRAIGNRIGEFTVLDATQLQLADIRHRLGDTPLFTPLLHVGWRQHVSPARQAVPVHLFAGEDFGPAYQADGYPHNGARQAEPLWELDGLLRVHLQHYLYINADFLLRQPGVYSPPQADTIAADSDSMTVPAASDGEESELVSLAPAANQGVARPFLMQYPFQQHRRVRSGELHYFDHPMFGMLVQIRRIE